MLWFSTGCCVSRCLAPGFYPGDSVPLSYFLNSASCAVAVGIVIVTSWVAMVLIENALPSRNSPELSLGALGWMTLSSISLGVGSWSCSLVLATAISANNLPLLLRTVSFNPTIFTSLLICLPASFIALLLVLLSAYDDSKVPGMVCQTHQLALAGALCCAHLC